VTVTNPSGTTVQAGVKQVGIQSVGSTNIAIAEGARTISFRVTTAGVAASTTVTLTATSGTDVVSTTLLITPASIRAVTLTPAAVVGGQSASAVITLDGAAPSGTGAAMQLAVTRFFNDGSARAVSDPAAAAAPATTQVSPGAVSVTVALTTTPVGVDQSAQITATLGASTSSGALVIKAPVITSLLLNPSTVVSGNSTTGTVTLSGPAPGRGVVVPLSTSNANATVPASITVDAGSSAKTFQVTTPPITTFLPNGGNTVTIGAHANTTTGTAGTIPDGASNTILFGESAPIRASATLTLLRAVALQSVSVPVLPAAGGAPVTLGLVFNNDLQQIAPGGTGFPNTGIIAGTAQITVDQPALVQLPATVTIPSNANTVLVRGTTTPPATDQNVTITTTFGSKTISTPLLLRAPIPALATFTLRPKKVKGGSDVIAEFQLTPAMTSAQVITLTTDRPDLIQLPASVTIPVSPVPTQFTFTTQAVAHEVDATITATAGIQRIPVVLTVKR
jgi:hypothetical protein